MATEKKVEMTSISIEVPSSLAGAFGATAEARARFATEALAIEAYRRGLESKSCLAAIVGIPRVDFESWLAERNVPDNGTFEEMMRGYESGRRFIAKEE